MRLHSICFMLLRIVGCLLQVLCCNSFYHFTLLLFCEYLKSYYDYTLSKSFDGKSNVMTTFLTTMQIFIESKEEGQDQK